MEKYCSRKIDEIGRLILPIELRAKMGLSSKEDKTKRFYVTLQRVGHIIVMQPTDKDTENSRKIDELGRISFSGDIIEEMDWGIRKPVEIYYVDDRMAIFK